MKNFRLIFSFALVFLTSSIVAGATQCPGNVVSVQYHPLPHSHIGVSVSINGSGPHEFMVDTGAQITVIDPALVRELKLETAGSLKIITVASNVEVPLVSANIIEVGPTSRRGIRMAVEDLGPIQADYPGVRGILGNNFLNRFDLLIDNGRKMLCFDDSGAMQRSLRGEHVPILSQSPSSGGPAAEAVLVAAHLPDTGKHETILRLDSGSNVPLLYTDRPARGSALQSGRTIGTKAQFDYAYTPERTARLGLQKEMQIAFAVPAGKRSLYSKTGEDGVLPTMLFKRIFISAANHFVIFEPR